MLLKWLWNVDIPNLYPSRQGVPCFALLTPVLSMSSGSMDHSVFVYLLPIEDVVDREKLVVQIVFPKLSSGWRLNAKTKSPIKCLNLRSFLPDDWCPEQIIFTGR